MKYKQAFIKLYGAAGAALDHIFAARVETQEHSQAINVLREAIAEVEELVADDDGEQGEDADPDPILTPSYHGAECAGNGQHEGIECCCDECDHYITCFPDWNEEKSMGV